jgi:hypothetical protein
MSMSFDWRVIGPEAGERAYYAWRSHRGPARRLSDELEHELRDAYCAGFAGGARWCVIATGNLAPSIAALSDFLTWLQRETESEREALSG